MKNFDIFSDDMEVNLTTQNMGGSSYTLSYDAVNRLMGVSGAITASFVYDGDGNRVKGTVSGTTTAYIREYFEWTGSTGTMRSYYFAGSTRVAMRSGSALKFLLGDHLGSTSVTTDANGAFVSKILFYPWGERRYFTGSIPTNYQFTDQRIESNWGLYFYNARWYDPYLNRWIQPDTIIPSDKDNNSQLIVDYHETQFLEQLNKENRPKIDNLQEKAQENSINSQAFDRYAYSYNNPVKYIDPTGHKVCHWGDPDKACTTYPDYEYRLDQQIEKPNDECKHDPQCVKSYLTYKAMVLQLHYIPSEQEILYMTIGSEYWNDVDKPYKGPPGYSPRSVGQEAVAREYYQFCGLDGCSASEMYKFMSGYEQWGGKVRYDKSTAYSRADALLGYLNNSYAGTGNQLTDDVMQILHHNNETDVAVYKGWIYGHADNLPWQFFTGPMPPNISFENDYFDFSPGKYAILAVQVDNNTYLFMFTYYQTYN